MKQYTPKRSIAQIAAAVASMIGPAKLARAPDPLTHDALLAGARDSPEPLALGVLADHMQDHGMPGAEFARLGHEQGRVGNGLGKPAREIGETWKHVNMPWLTEHGTDADQSWWVPHSLEVYPTSVRTADGGVALSFTVAHTGSETEAARIGYHVRIPDWETFARAIRDLSPGLKKRLTQFAVGEWGKPPRKGKPAKLAREAVTYVGGSVPGGQRALGAWAGGTERATVVKLPAEHAANIAIALAQRNRQKTAIWFTPGTGTDLLHVLTVPGRPGELRKALNKHGVTYATLVPGSNGTTVHVVDHGGELRGPMQTFAAEKNTTYTPASGTAGYANVKLARSNAEAIANTSGQFIHDPDHPSYVPAHFAGRVIALEPRYHSGRQRWVWSVAANAHARGWLHSQGWHGPAYNVNPGDTLLQAQDHVNKPLTPHQLWAADLEGGEAPMAGDAEEALGRSNESMPEDFYA